MIDEIGLLLPGGADEPARSGLARFGELLLLGSAAANLTGAKDAAAVVEHIADALSIRRFVRGPLIDVGSGGGLPGIPIAIATGIDVTLVEATIRKARFLEDTLRALDIHGRVVVGRAEDVAHDPQLREHFACATARALGGLSTVLELTLPFLSIGGVAVLQRGAVSDDERRAAVDAALMLGGELVGEERLGERRRVLLVEKVSATPARFPRRTGVPTKRPLGVRSASVDRS